MKKTSKLKFMKKLKIKNVLYLRKVQTYVEPLYHNTIKLLIYHLERTILYVKTFRIVFLENTVKTSIRLSKFVLMQNKTLLQTNHFETKLLQQLKKVSTFR